MDAKDRLQGYADNGKFRPGSPDGCWPWRGPLDRDGYGRATEYIRAHRLVYTALVAPIEPGMHIDHLCHTRDEDCPGGVSCPHRRCVNPAHLEPVIQAENNLRGRSPQGVNSRKDTCVHGHPFDAANTYIRPSGQRDCRACTSRRQAEYQRRKRTSGQVAA